MGRPSSLTATLKSKLGRPSPQSTEREREKGKGKRGQVSRSGGPEFGLSPPKSVSPSPHDPEWTSQLHTCRRSAASPGKSYPDRRSNELLTTYLSFYLETTALPANKSVNSCTLSYCTDSRSTEICNSQTFPKKPRGLSLPRNSRSQSQGGDFIRNIYHSTFAASCTFDFLADDLICAWDEPRLEHHGRKRQLNNERLPSFRSSFSMGPPTKDAMHAIYQSTKPYSWTHFTTHQTTNTVSAQPIQPTRHTQLTPKHTSLAPPLSRVNTH